MAELGTALLLMAREEHSPAAGGGCVLAEVVGKSVEEQRHLLGGKPVEVEVHTDPGTGRSPSMPGWWNPGQQPDPQRLFLHGRRTVVSPAGRPFAQRERYRQRYSRPRHRPGFHPPFPRHDAAKAPASACPWSSGSATAMAGRCGWKARKTRARWLKSCSPDREKRHVSDALVCCSLLTRRSQD